MFRKSLFLACAAVLALGTAVRADEFTTNINLQSPWGFGSTGPIAGMTNISGSAGESYTVQLPTVSPAPEQNNAVYATGGVLLGNYNFGNPAVSKGLGQSAQLVLTYAIQGTQTSTSGLIAGFTKAVFGIYSIPNSVNFSGSDATTWGALTTGGKLLYSGSIVAPTTTNKGVNPFGDSTFGGQAVGGQNLAAFNVSTTNATDGAFISHTNSNAVNSTIGTAAALLFNTPNAFDGFQIHLNEVNALSPGETFTPMAGANDNATLDMNFDAVAALDASQGFDDLSPFLTFSPTQDGSNGDTLQGITGLQAYPINTPAVPPPPPPGVPEIDPNSIAGALTLLGGGLAYLTGRLRRKKKS